MSRFEWQRGCEKTLSNYTGSFWQDRKTQVWSLLPSWANPTPDAIDFISGITNLNPKAKEPRCNVVQALHSTKMHFHTELKGLMMDGGSDEGGPWTYDGKWERWLTASGVWSFDQLWPDTRPGAEEVHPLSQPCYDRMVAEGVVKGDAHLLLHILNKHEGEARIVIDRGFEPWPDDGVVDVHNACFWHYQYARTKGVRDWLYKRWLDTKTRHEPLTDEQIQWILKAERNRTLILRWEPRVPASGELQPLDEGDWEIRSGNYITLAELFSYGARKLTCFHLYEMYMCLDYYIHRKNHSEPTSEEAITKQKAKALHKQENGSWILPAPGAPWKQKKRSLADSKDSEPPWGKRRKLMSAPWKPQKRSLAGSDSELN